MTARAPQLTARALASGAAIGGVLCVANVYVVLKTGWSLGVTLSSTIIAFGVFRALERAGLVRAPLGILENATVSSTASAAAFMTGGGNMAALPALVMLTGHRPGALALFVWFAVIAALGVVTAIPLKRRIIDEEDLPFPLGAATASTLRAMHAGEGADRARTLFGAATLAGAWTVVREARWLPERISLGGSFGIDASLVLLGGGALMAPRTAVSMFLGAVLTYGVLAPALVASTSYKEIVAFTLWPGAAMLVTSAVVALLLRWRSALGGARDLFAALVPRAHDDGEEAPLRWFAVGLALLSPIAVVLMNRLFAVPWWAGVLAIPLALLMGVVAGRVTGETDMSPTKALGPVTQLVFGALVPAHLVANLMSANVTGGVGLHAGDLLTDLKAGKLVGARPRLQVIAQLVGVLVGAAAVVPAFALLVPNADALGTVALPAPAVLVWASVSRALSGGLAGLPEATRAAAAIGALVGALLAALEAWWPAARRYAPSAAGVGMAMVMPASTTLAMCLGAAIAAGVRKTRPGVATRTLPFASGLIAGESVVGMAVALVRALGR
jgi:uncharacterized oligopeptide transporter (OPT) family protein